MSEYKKYIPLAILVILASIVFLFAVQSNQAGNFYEFDPYMYMELTTLLAQHGSIPVSGLAYPCGASCSSNRFGVIIPYWLAGYLKLTGLPLYQIANLYPPIMLILMAILLYAFFDNKVAKISAVVLLFSFSIIFQQFTGGMFQEEAVGFMSVIAVFVSLYFALKNKSLAYSFFAGVIYIGSLLGSKYFTVTTAIIPAIAIAYILYLFILNNKDELKHTLKVFTILSIFAIIGNAGLLAYRAGFALSGLTIHNIFVPINLLAIIGIALINAVFYLILAKQEFMVRIFKTRVKLKPTILLIGILLIASIPILPHLVNYLSYLVSYQHVQNTIPLFETVQEFAPAFASIQGLGIFSNVYMLWGAFAVITIVLLYETIMKIKRHENILVEIMIIMTFYPLWYIGTGVAKYIPDLALVLVIGLAYVIDKIMEKVD